MPNGSMLTRGFGHTVREWRQAAGMTQEQLAEEADLTPRYVGQLERGHQSPTLRVVEALALALQRRPWELIHDAELAGIAQLSVGNGELERS